MIIKDVQILYDAKGKRSHVLMPIERYEEILRSIEDAEDRAAVRATAHDKTQAWADVKKRLKKKM